MCRRCATRNLKMFDQVINVLGCWCGMLFFTVVVSALIWATQATPTGNHTCTGVVKHPVTVRVNVTEPVTFRTYTWCLRVPPRCSKYTIQLKDRIKIHTEMHNRTITVCCKGYVEMDYKCVPACPPQTDCPFMHCNRTNHCYCTPGYTGLYCNEPCDRGFWGTDCMKTCDCPSGYTCHHLTGDCLLDDRPPSKTRRTTTTTAITSAKPTSTIPTLTTVFLIETTDPMTSTTVRASTPAQTTTTKEVEFVTSATRTTEATTLTTQSELPLSPTSTTTKVTSTTETPTTMKETEGTTTRSTTEINDISHVPTVSSTVSAAAYTESTTIPTSIATTTTTPSTTTTTPTTTTTTPSTTTTTPSTTTTTPSTTTTTPSATTTTPTTTTTTPSTTTTTPSITITETTTTILHSTINPLKEYPSIATEQTTTTTESPTTKDISTWPTTLTPKTTLSPASPSTELVSAITTVHSTTTVSDLPTSTIYSPTATSTSPSFTTSPSTPTTYTPTSSTEFQIMTNTPAKTTTESMMENTHDITTTHYPTTTKTYSTIVAQTVPSTQTTASTAAPSVTESTTTTATTIAATSSSEKIKPTTDNSATHFEMKNEFIISSTTKTSTPPLVESNEDLDVAPTFKSNVLETTTTTPKQEIVFAPVELADKIGTTQPNIITTLLSTSPNINKLFETRTEINTFKPNIFIKQLERTTEQTVNSQTEFSTKASNFDRATERTPIQTTVLENIFNPVESYPPEPSVIESPIETVELITSTLKPNTSPADTFLNIPFHAFNVSDKQPTSHLPKEIKIYNSDTLFRQFSTKSPINKNVDDRNNDNLAALHYLNIRTLPTQSIIAQTPTPFPFKETETSSSMTTVTEKPTVSVDIQTEAISSQMKNSTTPDLEISKRNYQESKIHYIKLASNEAQSPSTVLPFNNERIKTALPAFELEKESLFDATTVQMTKSPKQHKEKYHKKHKSIKHFEHATTDSPHNTVENKFETTATNKPFEPTDYKLLPGINKPYKFYPKSHTKTSNSTLGNETWIRNVKSEESTNANHPTTLKPFETVEKDEVKITQFTTTETNPSWTTGKPSHTWYSHVREKAKIKEAMKTIKTTSVSDNSNYHIKPTEVYDRDSNDINSMQTSYTEMVKNMRESQDDKIIDQLLEKNRHNLTRIVVAGIHAEKTENDFYSAATLIIGFCVMMLMTLVTLLWLRLKKKARQSPETSHGSSILAFTPQTETMSSMIYETVYPISEGPELLEATTFFCPTFTNHYAERINRELSELNYDQPRRTSIYESTFAEVRY